MRLEPARIFRIALATSLAISALLFFAWSWRWPLVGDASLMHYVGFLIQRGWVPYRDLGDMNMPGSYLIEIAAMHLFGTGDLAWRIFDFTLLAITSASFFSITNSDRKGAPFMTVSSSWVGSQRLAALFAGSLFILIHGRDGLAEGGQRDLIMAVCLIAATAFLFTAIRKNSVWPALAFGLLSGIAVTIKPTAVLLTFAQLLIAAYALRNTLDKKQKLLSLIAPATLGYLIAPAIVLIFLLREHALPAFIAGLHGIVPYYASLGHHTLGFILLHSISPLLPLVIVWLVLLALDRTLRNSTLHWSQNWERALLLAGVLFGLINCIIQARALPYYRYPLLAFLLPLMALDFTSILDSESAASQHKNLRTRTTQILAILALAFGGLFLAPQSAILIHRYRWWENDLITSLTQDLNTLGGAQLSGHIQCIDTNSGCGNVLYRMSLEPANGVLSDFLLFGSDQAPVVRQTREQFSAAVHTNPPQVLVVTSYLYLTDLDHFRKLDRWPAFGNFLAADYTLETQWSPTRTARWWSREETPASYRIYVLKSSASTPPTNPHP